MYYTPGLKTLKCKILEIRNSMYSVIVIQDLTNNNFLMLTVFPNWQEKIPNIEDIGYVEFEFVKAGDEYYDKNDNKKHKYNNTYLVYHKFIKCDDNIKNNKITI